MWAQVMTNLKNADSPFMTSYSHHKGYISVQEDNVAERSRIKWSFVVCQVFLFFWLLP